MGWTEWSREVERDRDVLERMLMRLLALACLADCLAGQPAHVRLYVLGILARGEAVARDFVIGMARDHGAPSEAPPLLAADPERLAASFRMLALVLAAILAQARRFSRWLRREARIQADPPVLQRGRGRPGERRPMPARPHRHAARGPPRMVATNARSI